MSRSVLLGLTVLLLAACSGPTIRGDADALSLLRGDWGWAGSEECRRDPQRLSVAEDRSRLWVDNEQGMSTGEEGDPVLQRFEYRILASGSALVDVELVNETRVDASGRPVTWQIRLIDRDRFCWHRSDWPAGGCTGQIRRCRGNRRLAQ